MLEQWCNERIKKSYFKNQNQNNFEISLNDASSNSYENLADNLLEQAWINKDAKFLNELIKLIESKKISSKNKLFSKYKILKRVNVPVFS